MRFLVPLATSMSGVDGPGGTGKTFLYRALLASIRSMKKIALATSMSGVAHIFNLMDGHSRFKISIGSEGNLSCNVSKQSGLTELLKTTSLIIRVEASMAERQDIEASRSNAERYN